MNDIYTRLGAYGFDPSFVREFILPDWWDDSLGSNPTNRAVAEGAISKMLGFSIEELSDPARSLSFPNLVDLKLKKGRKDHDASQLRSTILLAEQAAASLLQCLRMQRFTGLQTARQAREAALRDRDFVDLDALLEFAWASGIAVLHLSKLPKQLKKFSGLAMFAGNAPVVVLGSPRDGAPWLAFHLAHEIGHILLGHVAVGKPPLADVDLDKISADEEETAADQFAFELLTGVADRRYKATYGMRAANLVTAARTEAAKLHADPGVVALIYGRTAERMGVAQNALKIMGMDRGGHKKIADAFRQQLTPDLPEVADRFVNLVAAR